MEREVAPKWWRNFLTSQKQWPSYVLYLSYTLSPDPGRPDRSPPVRRRGGGEYPADQDSDSGFVLKFRNFPT